MEQIAILGECRYLSPKRVTVSDKLRIPLSIVSDPDELGREPESFELAGPRERLYFDPSATRAGIVTCGGLCPGMNNVIRSVFLELYHGYGLRDVIGFRDGYSGLDPAENREPLHLTPAFVDHIHREGGSALGTSRGPVDPATAVKNLMEKKISILFTIGGDGTQKGANALYAEARKHDYPLSVVGVPKTVDNDVRYVSRTFGYLTAVEQAARALQGAHTEARSVQNGIALVKLMGRHAGFIAAGATVASQDVNFCLIPEVPFTLQGRQGLLPALRERILKRSHALIVVAEGAGQDLLGQRREERDASGNVKLGDIGLFLRQEIDRYFKQEGITVVMRYIDPSYLIRSVPADAEDSVMCDLFARNAVHAAMAGKTGLVIGLIHDRFIHVPIGMLAGQQKRLDPRSGLWQAVLAATGQPARFE